MTEQQPENNTPRRGRRATREMQEGVERGEITAVTARGEIIGRNGEVLSRKRKGDVDAFDVPDEIVPKGWKYQWNAISVVGNTDVVMDQTLGMFENGWRPVPASRHPGRYVPHGREGAIVRGGLRLEERPIELDNEARAEDEAKARKLMRDRDQSLMGSKANLRGAMKGGFSMDPRYRGAGGDLRMSIDPGIDIPTPTHQLADDDT